MDVKRKLYNNLDYNNLPKEIVELEERLKTRFEMGLAVDIQAPDYETRLAILRKKAQDENIIIEGEFENVINKRTTRRSNTKNIS